MLSIQVPTLKQGFILRSATMEDAPDALAIMRACDIAVTGSSDKALDELVIELEIPSLNLETDTRIISTPDGRSVGFAIVMDPAHTVTPEIDVYVHPDWWSDLTLAPVLMYWAEERAREAIAKVPADAWVAMHAYTYSKDAYYKSVLENAGMHLIRHAFRMVIDLDQPLARPEWPTGLSLRIFRAGEDKRAVLEAMRGSFQDHWGYVEVPFDEQFEHWSHYWDEDFDPSLWFLAMDGDQIAGICLCRPRRGDDESLGWVSTLGVTRPYRRLGVGMALLLHAFHELKSRGKDRVGLGVDASSLTGATRLYEKAGMQV
jgi:mycothiol synthase